MKILRPLSLLLPAAVLLLGGCGGSDSNSSSSITGTWQSGNTYFTFGSQDTVNARTSTQVFTGTYTAQENGEETNVTMSLSADNGASSTSIRTEGSMRFLSPTQAVYTPVVREIGNSGEPETAPDPGNIGEAANMTRL